MTIISLIISKELTSLRYQQMIDLVAGIFLSNGSRFMAFATFLTFVYNGGVLTPEVLYLTLNIFHSMVSPLTSKLPSSITDITQARMSAKRIQVGFKDMSTTLTKIIKLFRKFLNWMRNKGYPMTLIKNREL